MLINILEGIFLISVAVN